MASIHKATVYLIDVNEEFGSVKEILEEVRCYNYQPNIKLGVDYGTKEFEWDDEVVVNKIDCTPEQVKEFFNNPPQKKQPVYMKFIVTISPESGVENVKIGEMSGFTTPFMYRTIDAVGNSHTHYDIEVEAQDVEEAKWEAKKKLIEHYKNKQKEELTKLEEALKV